MKLKQQSDPDIKIIVDAKEQKQKPSKESMLDKSAEARHYWVIWDALTLINGVLYKYFQKHDSSDWYQQLIVPRSLRTEVLKLSHDGLMGGHLGTKKTKAKVNQAFYWYNMREDIKL